MPRESAGNALKYGKERQLYEFLPTYITGSSLSSAAVKLFKRCCPLFDLIYFAFLCISLHFPREAYANLLSFLLDVFVWCSEFAFLAERI